MKESFKNRRGHRAQSRSIPSHLLEGRSREMVGTRAFAATLGEPQAFCGGEGRGRPALSQKVKGVGGGRGRGGAGRALPRLRPGAVPSPGR